MSSPVPLAPQPGAARRLLGSMILLLGGGFVLETSYQRTGIVIIMLGIFLVVLGWNELWKGKHESQIK